MNEKLSYEICESLSSKDLNGHRPSLMSFGEGLQQLISLLEGLVIEFCGGGNMQLSHQGYVGL